MLIDCISDLHGHLPKLDGGDLLIIAGDLTKHDRLDEYKAFDQWLRNQQYRKKVVVAGNHDNFLEFGYKIQYGDYLQDSGTEFEGLKIWGSPWTKRFDGMNPRCMAFTVETEEELAEKWKLIPADTDILVTHGPPYGVLDRTLFDTPVGSLSLYREVAILNRVEPTLHVFGHVHEGYGCVHQPKWSSKKPRWIVNASLVNEHYEPVNKPIRIEL